MYAVLLAIGIHHREMIQRKSINYERILNVEINKTNDLIGKLLPHHMLNVVKQEKRQVDEFDGDLTLLYCDLIGINNFKGVKDSREVVLFLQKLFSRFDQLCDENKVYKVHTNGNKYVVMGYNGKIDKNRRSKNVVLDEANKIIQTGFEMLEIMKEVKEQSFSLLAKELKVRIGIHTGRVIAGIIGSKVVRYDIYGDGVLIANKVEQYGIEDEVCCSEFTKGLLQKQPEVSRQYKFDSHRQLNLRQISRNVQTYRVEQNQVEEDQESQDNSHEITDSERDDKDFDESLQQDTNRSLKSSIEHERSRLIEAQ